MPDNVLLAKYSQQQVVKDRNYGGLVVWSASVSAQPIPVEKPAADWVRLRLMAERIPQATDTYVLRTLPYFLQDPAVQTNIREYLHPLNSETTEVALAAQVDSAIAAFMPRFAAIEITDPQVELWYVQNGFDA